MVRLTEVIPYKPEWTAQYNEEANKIADILDHELIEIHHIGSNDGLIPGTLHILNQIPYLLHG